ncbi:MAG: phosphatase PAP2 family protein [candidate division Zixibacteria bacterium]|nr:phosphatase PAP2 family protein [candidate division Zixibacteria bacterium]
MAEGCVRYNLYSYSARPIIQNHKYPQFDYNSLDSDQQSDYWPNSRKPFRDIYRMGRTFVTDFAYIYSSPARFNTGSALWLGGILATGGVIYAFDQEILDAFQRNRDHKLYKPIRQLGEKFERLGFMGYTNRFYVGFMALGYLTKIEPMVTIPAEILGAHLVEGAGKNIMGITVGRARPYENLGPRHFEYNKGSSFPSGHSIVVMQVASVVSRRVDFLPVKIGMYTIATAVCFERITSNEHWPSDVYFGAVYGWIISSELLKLHDRRKFKVTPTAMSGGGGLRLSFSF